MARRKLWKRPCGSIATWVNCVQVMMRQLFVFTGSSPDDLAKFTRDQYEGFKGKMKTIGLEAD